MTEGSTTDVLLPEEWEADGQEEYLIPINSRQMWMGQTGPSLESLTMDHSGNRLMCSCGEVCDPSLGIYYTDQTEDRSDNPQLQWKMEQEEMIKEYLSVAYKDLMQKKEMCGVKQERLRIAREELNAKLEALNRARSSTCDLNSSLAMSNGCIAGGGKVVRRNPEELKAEVEMVRQRIKNLVLELVRMRSSVNQSEKGIDALTMVNKMISDRGRGEMWVNDAGKMVRGIRGMNASIKAGEEKRRELIKSVADLSQHFLATNPNLQSMPSMPSSDQAFACADSASQTELSGDLSKRYGMLAKLKLNHNQNKRCIMELLEQLIEVESQLIPCKIQFDANRLLLIEEKNKLVEELKRHQQSADSEERIRDLEEDLYKVKEIFKKDIQLDNQRLNLTKKKVKLEEELLSRAKLGTNLEIQIKSLHQSMNSISSGSSLGSLGSLSASSRGSQNSVALHDVYCMQELNKSIHQVNLPDLHTRIETIFQDQHPQRTPSQSSSRSQLGSSLSFANSSNYIPQMGIDVNSQSISDMGRAIPSFQQYPTVQEEAEDGDEGFEGNLEEETAERTGSYSGLSHRNISKPPPSYEDHFQMNNGLQKGQQSLGTCLYQQAPHSQIFSQPVAPIPDGFYPNDCFPITKSYCLYEQPQYRMSASLLPKQNTHNVHMPQTRQRQDFYQQQYASPCGMPSVRFQATPTRNYSSDAQNDFFPITISASSPGYQSGCQKMYNNAPYPNNLLSSNSLPSLLNAPLTNAMTSCGSESRIFRSGVTENISNGYDLHPPSYEPDNRSNPDGERTLPDMTNVHLRTDRLPTLSRSLLREFGVDNDEGGIDYNKVQQLADIQSVRNLQRQYFADGIPLEQTQLAKNLESSSARSMPTCHIMPPLNAFSPKSSSTSHLHNLNEGALSTNSNHSNFVSNQSSLSLSCSSLGEDGSNLGSDSGVFESASRLNNVLSAQIHVQLIYDYAKQEILVCIERARNLSAVSIHSLNEVVFKVFILPSTTNCDSYVEDTDPSSPLHSLPSYSNLGKVFHFPVESEKVLSKTIQVYVLRLKDFNSLHQRSYSRVESVGMSLISLASFDLKSCISSWYNILSFQFMDVDTNKCMPPPIPSLSPEIEASLPPVAYGPVKRVVEFKSPTICLMKDESSDESTVASSRTSTLTRAEEFEDASKNKVKALPPSSPSLISKVQDVNNVNHEVEELNEDGQLTPPVLCDKETNTDNQKAALGSPATPYFMRKPIAPGSKFNREIAIRRWQTFSPTAVPSEEEDHNHKLSRSGSDSSVRRKNSHFDRQAVHRQSIRLKIPLLNARKRAGMMNLSKNQTSIDLMLDYQAYKTKLENLNKEITALQTIKKKLKEAKERGETEPSWLLENEELQALLQETSGTFREKACDRKKLSDVTDLADRKIRKVKMEMLSLRARKSMIEIDRMVFKKKMNFFASPDDNLSFLDQVETEIDDPDGKDAEEDNSSGTGESRAESKSVPLSIKPPNPNNNDDADDFQNLIF